MVSTDAASDSKAIVGGSRKALLHEEKQSQRFGTRAAGVRAVLLISMFPRVYIEPATQWVFKKHLPNEAIALW